MSKPNTLVMPLAGSSSIEDAISVKDTGSIIVVGANGSGKTRLGNWLEFSGPQQLEVYRIGAQKSLNFPVAVSPTSLVGSRISLHYGINSTDYDAYIQGVGGIEQNLHSYRARSKWQSNPVTSLLDDFHPLLTYLFTDDYEISTKYRKDSIANPGITAPVTILDRIVRAWTQVLPHRQLNISVGQVTAQSSDINTAPYQAREMSDGERVAFYLIGQCLSAPLNNIIVVDEPEIHLHRVIQARLWDTIEQERPDCLFVYLTHDLEFAASRTSAKKIWLKDFNGTAWDWKEIPEQESIPEELLLTVLGSRKPVLFTEGDRGGSEQAIFSRVYPDWTIMPCGNCEQVIESTKAFTALKHLHGNECRGIIDRDYRTDQEIADLLAKGIHVLDVQEIENVLLTEDVLTAVVDHTLNVAATITGTVAGKVAEIKTFFFQQLEKDQQLLTSRRAGWEIEKTLRKFDAKAVGLPALQAAVQATAALDVPGIYAGIEAEFARILTAKDYPALLLRYNNKGLAKQAGRFFGIPVSYPEYVKRLISGGKGEPIVAALRAACPVLPMALAMPATAATLVP
jgi:ABC-type cobalamin/Fe3+-siderophores transport system ATPase subunit